MFNRCLHCYPLLFTEGIQNIAQIYDRFAIFNRYFSSESLSIPIHYMSYHLHPRHPHLRVTRSSYWVSAEDHGLKSIFDFHDASKEADLDIRGDLSYLFHISDVVSQKRKISVLLSKFRFYRVCSNI